MFTVPNIYLATVLYVFYNASEASFVSVWPLYSSRFMLGNWAYTCFLAISMGCEFQHDLDRGRGDWIGNGQVHYKRGRRTRLSDESETSPKHFSFSPVTSHTWQQHLLHLIADVCCFVSGSFNEFILIRYEFTHTHVGQRPAYKSQQSHVPLF